jgi:hypothetical protein
MTVRAERAVKRAKMGAVLRMLGSAALRRWRNLRWALFLLIWKVQVVQW